MSVIIITDSACDIDLKERSRLRVETIGIRVFFGEDTYLEGENMTAAQFYGMLAEAAELPKTAQITPLEFEERIRPHIDAGDDVVVLPLSKELSGTYGNAVAAAAQFPKGRVYVVDTKQVTFGLALMVQEAADMRDAGAGAGEIARAMEALSDRIRLYAVVDDLKYLRMGGRLSSAGAVVGTLLGVKPIISIEEGKVVCVQKVRGLKAGYASILERVRNEADPNRRMCIGHSDAPALADELAASAGDLLEGVSVYRSSIGPVVGTHAGPGCAGISFIAK